MAAHSNGSDDEAQRSKVGLIRVGVVHVAPTPYNSAFRVETQAMRYLATILLLSVLWLAGCGQKGPLHLPEDEQSETAG